MNVADLREQVVLDLVVQASTYPRQHCAACAKVGGGAHLVGQGVDFQHRTLLSRDVVVVFHDMRRLENDRQDESGHKLHHHPSTKDLQPVHAAEDHGQHPDVGEVQRFGEGERGRQFGQ